MKRFSELNVDVQDDRKIFECPQVSITDEEGNETEVYREGFTSYDEGNYPFELTEEYIQILRPENNDDIDI